MSRLWAPREKPAVGWTVERVELLTKLWADGLSCLQIAKELGGVSRNSVIGKVHRLRLPGRGKAATLRDCAISNRSRAGLLASSKPRYIIAGSGVVLEKPPGHAPRAIVPQIDEPPGACTLLTLTEHHCKWPVGDPNSDDFTFCGAKRERGSYCNHHAGRAYQPDSVKSRSDERPEIVPRRRVAR